MDNFDNFNIQLKDKYSRGDWFPIPRYFLALTKQGALSKSEYIFLTLLISSDNFFTLKQNSWFFCPDKKFYETKLISKKKVIEARRSLKKKQIIEYKKGYSNHATEYRILLENYCYRGNHY
ncbi:MAG: hypothetical protein NTX47_01480, partial [Candidatus Omnitrophica bacterium]|nr:hypothetical protein [Candidatus Omnitrophota bacterium]